MMAAILAKDWHHHPPLLKTFFIYVFQNSLEPRNLQWQQDDCTRMQENEEESFKSLEILDWILTRRGPCMTEPLEQAIHESSYDATCSTNDSRRI
jgi:hypothetical protein